MAWDCTLHVVADISFARFAARFLHGLHRGAAFDREYDSDDLIGNVKQMIAEDPVTGARALGELALLYVSTETPHLYCRGFALSLWDEAVMGAALPAKWLGTVETHLSDVIAAYPKIAGKVPRKFDDNYCVGPVVSAKDVPALLAHVEQVLAGLADRARYQPLVDVLKIAAARGLCYWEGTDIDVIQTHADWIATVRPSPVVTAASSVTMHARPLAIAGTRMLVGDQLLFHELELATFPPAVITHEDMQVTTAAVTPWGTQFVRMVTDRTVRPFKFGYFELPGRQPLAIEPGVPIGLVRPARDSLLLFPHANAGKRPLVMRRNGAAPKLEPLAIPDPVGTASEEGDAITFGDGTLLVLWGGVPYHWDGKSVVSLGGTLEPTDELGASTVLADGSIVGGFGRKLVRITRAGERTTVLPLDNVMMVARGPDDVLIIGEGDNPEGDFLKLWWPATRELTHVGLDAFELADRPAFTYFDATAQLVVTAGQGKWHALPWRELEAMRRVSEDEFTSRRQK